MTPGAVDTATPESRRRAANSLLEGLARPRILAAMSPAQPDELLAALIDVALERGALATVVLADLPGIFSFLDDRRTAALRSGDLRLVTLAGAVPAPLARYVDHVPRTLWDVDRLLASGALAVDVVVARVHETSDAARTLGHGSMVGYTTSAFGLGARVCLEVAREVDAPPGPVIEIGRDWLVLRDEAWEPPAAAGPARADAAADEIGRLVAQILPRGADLQLGLGAVPEAVINHLRPEHDVVLRSGILPGSVLAALLSITGERTLSGEHHVATGVMPSPAADLRWSSTAVTLRPVSATHAPDSLASLPRLWAVNSAFEIDLHGQVNAEYARGIKVASAGGQIDFAQGAHLSAEGAVAPRPVGDLTREERDRGRHLQH